MNTLELKEHYHIATKSSKVLKAIKSQRLEFLKQQNDFGHDPAFTEENIRFAIDELQTTVYSPGKYTRLHLEKAAAYIVTALEQLNDAPKTL